MKAFLPLLLTIVALADETQPATTHHQVHVGGSVLSYTACAGLIPIRNNEAGDIHANIFYISYALDRPANKPPRPVTFVWNGGPGSNSALVHLSGFGPRRIQSVDDPAHPAPVAPAIVDNEATWLEFTDLVFVDPVGTGFSRPAKAEYESELYSTLGDIASIAEFVRVFRTRFDLFDAPLFLAGESYGTWRASGVAEALEKRGQRVAGVILISGGIQMGPVSPDPVRVALFVPSRAAAAFYHHKLAPELMRDEKATLQEAESWALAEYAPAWERRDQLSDEERNRVIERLAHYTGVEVSAIDRKTLMMTSPQFTAALLRDQKTTLGRYDMRLKSSAASGESAGRNLAIARYLRQELQFSTDLAYNGVEDGYYASAPPPRSIGARWAWDQVEKGTDVAAVSNVGSGDGPPPAQPWLRRALAVDPSLKVFLVAGMYDSLNSCADNHYLVAHIQPAEFGRNITEGCYPGGHMMYDTKAAREQLQRDAAAFVRSAAR